MITAIAMQHIATMMITIVLSYTVDRMPMGTRRRTDGAAVRHARRISRPLSS